MSAITLPKKTHLTITLFKDEPNPIEITVDDQFKTALQELNNKFGSQLILNANRFSELANKVLVEKSIRYRIESIFLHVVCGMIIGAYLNLMVVAVIRRSSQGVLCHMDNFGLEKKASKMFDVTTIISIIAVFALGSLLSSIEKEELYNNKTMLVQNLERSWEQIFPFLENKESILLLQIESLRGESVQEIQSVLETCRAALRYFQSLNANRNTS